jgi:SAM-dependent methyltransferase
MNMNPTNTSNNIFTYATPEIVTSPENLFFYHSIELPGHGLMKGDWDLRAADHEYLGNVDLTGMRCLDIGAASGYLSFKMEKLGASEVVSYDMKNGSDWDIVPHFKLAAKMGAMRRSADEAMRRLKQSYWFSHRALQSRAKAVYCDIYSIPEGLGSFDFVFYGMILTHLRDPYLALYNGARLCRDTIVVTGVWTNDERPISTWRPSGDKCDTLSVKGWWLLSKGTIKNMLGTLGFSVVDTVESEVMVNSSLRPGPCTCEAIVAKRVAAI